MNIYYMLMQVLVTKYLFNSWNMSVEADFSLNWQNKEKFLIKKNFLKSYLKFLIFSSDFPHKPPNFIYIFTNVYKILPESFKI